MTSTRRGCWSPRTGRWPCPDPVSSLDSLPLGASRTLEGERLRAARQGELEMTIKQIDGVESVRVHLAEASKSVFVRDDAPPTASVMVRMAKGRKLADGQVSAIVNLVAGSVPGLSPDAVRVVDQHGRLLSDPRAQGLTGWNCKRGWKTSCAPSLNSCSPRCSALAISPARSKLSSTWTR
jgi:type III secretory pathway lipoprotein EscJ